MPPRRPRTGLTGSIHPARSVLQLPQRNQLHIRRRLPQTARIRTWNIMATLLRMA
jgi:hypothetical protein